MTARAKREKLRAVVFFWFLLLIFLATTIVGQLLAPKPKFNAPQPSGLGDFRFPTAQEGRAIPVIYGTVKIQGGNTVWWGDLNIVPIKKRVRTGLFSHSNITTGYKYYLGAQFALCQGSIDKLIGLEAQKKAIPYSSTTILVGGNENCLSLTLAGDNLFGGTDKEGGISGNINLYRGIPTQQSDAYLTAKTGRTSPKYPTLCYAVMKGLYLGTSSYVKPIAFIVQRCPDPFGQGASVAQINNASDGADANPVLAIYDAMTNPAYGLGIPAARFDVNVWKAAAQTCATEGLGISMQFDSQSTADNLIGEILRHCDGVIYTDPSTGLWEIVLARGGYDPTTLPVLTVDNVIDTPDYSRGSWSETSNQIQIRYLDRASNFNTRTAQAQDTGNIAVTGEVRNQAIDFNGLSRASTAALVATRVLKTMSYPLSKLTVTTNRVAWSWRPGGLFKFTWLPLGINNQVFRITRISYGEILNGKITIDAVEDIFGISSVAYDPPPSSGWISPIGAPQAPAVQMLVEVPYHIVYWAQGLTMGIYAMAFCARGDSTSKSFEIWLNEGAGDFVSQQIYAFTPVGQLQSGYSAATPANDATGFVLDLPGQIDLLNLASVSAADQIQGVNLLMIDQEIMSWTTITANSDGTYTIAGIMRGVMDTVPQTHGAGARVWFFSEGVGETKTDPYASDLTVSAKLLPINDLGEYPLSSASSISVTTASRNAKPYPPGCLQEQAQGYGTRFSSVVGDFTVTWKSRNRLTQTASGTITRQDALDIAGEAGQTFTVRIFLNSSLIRTVTGITTPEQYTYTAAQRVADDPDGSKTVTIKISSVVGGLESFLPNSTEAVTMTGFGMDFGNFFGGLQA